MKKLFATLVFIAFLVGGIIHAGSAQAASNCTNYGTTQAIQISAEASTANYLDYTKDAEPTFNQKICTVDTYIRLYRVAANTPDEYQDLKSFSKAAPAQWNTMFCKTGKNRGYFAGLATATSEYVSGTNDYEASYFNQYLRDYKKSHRGCKLYTK